MKGKIRKAGFDENFLKCAGAPKGSQIIMTGEKAGIGKGLFLFLLILYERKLCISERIQINGKSYFLMDLMTILWVSFAANSMFEEAKIMVLKMRSHTSNRVQFPDVSFVAPEKSFLGHNFRLYLQKNPGKKIDQGSLFNHVIVATQDAMKNKHTIQESKSIPI